MHHLMNAWVAVAVTMAVLLGAAPAWADDAQAARQLVEKVTLTLEQFRTEPNVGPFRDLATKAKGMLIVPRTALNEAYYGKAVSPTDIAIKGAGAAGAVRQSGGQTPRRKGGGRL